MLVFGGKANGSPQSPQQGMLSKCTECEKLFISYDHLVAHLVKKHPGASIPDPPEKSVIQVEQVKEDKGPSADQIALQLNQLEQSLRSEFQERATEEVARSTHRLEEEREFFKMQLETVHAQHDRDIQRYEAREAEFNTKMNTIANAYESLKQQQASLLDKMDTLKKTPQEPPVVQVQGVPHEQVQEQISAAVHAALISQQHAANQQLESLKAEHSAQLAKLAEEQHTLISIDTEAGDKQKQLEEELAKLRTELQYGDADKKTVNLTT